MLKSLAMISALTTAALAAQAVDASLNGDTNKPEMSVYAAGEDVELNFKANGLDPAAKDLKLAIDIVDEAEKPVKKIELPVAPDAQGSWTGKVKAPSEKLGFYRARVKLSNGVTLPAIDGPGGPRPAGFLTYAVVVDPAKRKLYSSADTVFGMQGGFNSKIQVLPYLGIRWVLGPGNWSNTEPDYPGQIVDKRNAAKAKGEKFPADNFAWAKYKDGGVDKHWDTYFFCNGLGSCCIPAKWKVPPFKSGTFDIGRAVLSADGEKQFESYCREFAKSIVESYPERQENLYEITWEPELFWKGTPEDMVRFYEIAYPAIHGVDPKAVIVGPAIHVPDFDYMELLLKAGLCKHLDMISIHYSFIGDGFERKLPVERIRQFKSLIRKYAGRDVPLMNTEFGMNTTAKDGAEQLVSSQQEVRAHLISLGEGFQHIIAFYVAAAGGGYFYNLNPKTGCGTDKTSPRPVAPAYSAMTFLLEGHKGAGAIDWLGDTAFGYAYENADDIVLALWDHGDKPREVVIPAGADVVKVFDWMGNESDVKTDGGALKLSLGPSPVYVKGVSPKLWGSKAAKPLQAKKGDVELFPGDETTLEFVVNASQGKALKGSVLASCPTELKIESPERKVELAEGATQTIKFVVKVSPQAAAKSYPVALLLRDGANVAGAAGASVKVSDPVKIGTLKPVFEPGGKKALKLSVQEAQGKACSGTLELKIKGIPESASTLKFSLKPKESKELVAVYDDLAASPLRKYEASMKVSLDSGYAFAKTAEVNFLSAKRFAKTPEIDGAEAKWEAVPFVELKGAECCVQAPELYSGDSAKIRFAWDEKALYARVDVKDDVFMQNQLDDKIWMDDSIQIGVCLEPFKEFHATSDAFADSFNKPKQVEINIALTKNGPVAYRGLVVPKDDKIPCGKLSAAECKLSILQKGDLTSYETAIPWTSLGLEKAPAAGEHIAVTVAVNDHDSAKSWQTSALSLFNGATGKKDPALMGLLHLEK